MNSPRFRSGSFRAFVTFAAFSFGAACAQPASPPAVSEPAPRSSLEPTPQATPPTSPEPADTAETAASTAPGTPAPPDSVAPAETAPPEPPADTSGPKPGRSAIDLITQRDVAFLVDYANSDARSKAEEKCEKEAADDPEKQGACLAKAREQFTADVLRFVRGEGGRTTFKIYKRNGSNLSELYVGPVELAEESPSSIRMKFKSAGKGTRSIFRAQKDAVLTLPNEYSLEIEDPELGTLTYSAKIGLVNN